MLLSLRWRPRDWSLFGVTLTRLPGLGAVQQSGTKCRTVVADRARSAHDGTSRPPGANGSAVSERKGPTRGTLVRTAFACCLDKIRP